MAPQRALLLRRRYIHGGRFLILFNTNAVVSPKPTVDALYGTCIKEHGYLSSIGFLRRYYEGLKATIEDYLLGLNSYDRPVQGLSRANSQLR